MMHYRVVWGKTAEADLAATYNYLKRRVLEARADHVKNSILKRVRVLRNTPYAFPIARRKDRLEQDLRTISIWSFVIHYLVDDERQMVIIEAVEHAHQDT